jgi:hypothetical protein
MHPESIGFTPQHAVNETYCPGCGNPESSAEHGIGCPQEAVERIRKWCEVVRSQIGTHAPDVLPLVTAVLAVLENHTPEVIYTKGTPGHCETCTICGWDGPGSASWPCPDVLAIIAAIPEEK